jgi:tetratricopeptide (TPR) repeat protein
VLSQLNSYDTAEWIREYDQFIASTSNMLSINVKVLPPLTVILFARSRDFAPYTPTRPNGQKANIAGLFVRQPSWSVIGLAQDSEDENTKHTIFHEGTHWLMSVDPARQPAWFAEGIAELFSTFERRGSKVNWGKPIGDHIFQLQRGGTMPLGEFLVQDSAIFDRQDHTGRFYAQSWAFVHFLLVSNDPARRALLIKYLNAYRTNSAAATVDIAFGSTLNDVDRTFKSYLSQPTFAYITKPVVPAADPQPLAVAPPAEVESALAFFALGGDKPELARQHVAKAMQLDPSLPGPHEVLAYLSKFDNEIDPAATHAEAALRNGSRDADMYLMLGDSYRFGANSHKRDSELQSVKMYENAINLNPRRLAAYEQLTQAIFEVDAPTAEDAKFMDLGVKAFPDEDWLKVGVASIAYHRGQREAAFAGMEKALRANGTLDAQQKAFATHVRGGWYMKEMNDEVRIAMEKRDFAAAHKSLDTYRGRIEGDKEAEMQLQEMQAGIDGFEQLDLAARARQAGKKAEANAILDKLLKQPDLPPELRRAAEQARR